ncbi:hypothetical protein [Helicobacter cetorum]|uniref:hypothetical protein n=1 Tax=Helicobacter cetorum TaxID=138563 RepID=UPI000CF06C34|nr:hypothetical protein [Helicobacter cetorum]
MGWDSFIWNMKKRAKVYEKALQDLEILKEINKEEFYKKIAFFETNYVERQTKALEKTIQYAIEVDSLWHQKVTENPTQYKKLLYDKRQTHRSVPMFERTKDYKLCATDFGINLFENTLNKDDINRFIEFYNNCDEKRTKGTVFKPRPIVLDEKLGLLSIFGREISTTKSYKWLDKISIDKHGHFAVYEIFGRVYKKPESFRWKFYNLNLSDLFEEDSYKKMLHDYVAPISYREFEYNENKPFYADRIRCVEITPFEESLWDYCFDKNKVLSYKEQVIYDLLSNLIALRNSAKYATYLHIDKDTPLYEI